MSTRTAIILAGGVAKGAFAAGALQALAARGLRFGRVVGASSGALNAAFWATAIRRGCPQEAAERIVRLWLDEGHWTRFLSPSVRSSFGGRGLSDSRRVSALLHDELSALPWTDFAENVQLRIVVTSLNGRAADFCQGVATTFEDVRGFSSEDFETAEGIGRVVQAATASAAFPGLFAPVTLDETGPAVDGGLVSNAPVKEAIDDGAIDRVFVVVPYPQVDRAGQDYAGTDLAGRLLEVLIQERLFRDLDEANSRNRALSGLGGLVSDGRITPEQMDAVLDAVGWHGLRRLDIVPIRPAQPLPGGSFSGFADRELRKAYVEEGRRAAEAVLDTCAA